VQAVSRTVLSTSIDRVVAEPLNMFFLSLRIMLLTRVSVISIRELPFARSVPMLKSPIYRG
jgi:hypothetical protein